MERFKLLLIAITILLYTGCVKKTPVLSFKIPDGWYIDDSIQTKDQKTYSIIPKINKDTSGFQRNIRVTAFNFSGLTSFSEGVINEFKKKYDFKEISKGIITVNQKEFTAIHFLSKNNKEQYVEGKAFFHQRIGKVYQIMFFEKKGDMEYMNTIIEMLLSSLKL